MNNFLKSFKQRIKKRVIKIAVVGLGYVGLPLALEFAKKGFRVCGIDIDKDRLNSLKKRKSYITDVSHRELRQVLSLQRFETTGDFRMLKETDVIIICVPTPLKRKYAPDISYIKQAVKAISVNLKKPSLIILESTTYPGTTEEVILPLLKRHNLKHNRDFYLCFSPERLDPGNRVYPVNKIPKIVGGISKEATALAVAVYKTVINKVVPVSSVKTAEAAKLLENTFRLINIGLINELAMMAHKMNIDIWEVIEAARTKPFGFMPFYPGPGVGGHCIGKDPLYLYWKARYHGFTSRFIKLASEMVIYMPAYIIKRVEDILDKNGLSFSKAKILLVGVTYKRDVKDLRKSPALDMIEILQTKGASIFYYDPLIPYLKINHIDLKRIKLRKRGLLSKFDCVIITTDHSNVDYDFILRNSRLIFDTRNVYKNINHKKIIKL